MTAPVGALLICASLNQTIVFMHAQRDSRPAFDYEGHILPKIFPPETNEWITRLISPICRRDGFPHCRRMRSLERFDLLVIIVKAGGPFSDGFGALLISVKPVQIAQPDPGLAGSNANP